MERKDASRREFMQTAARTAAGVALGAGAARTARADVYKSILPQTIVGANEKIRTGHIGMGGMGMANLRYVLERDDMAPIAVCDLYPPHRERAEKAAARKSPQATIHHDFREVIENKDVDAVVISTPDHWHAIPAIMACDAGKDVWCEKPLSTTIEEGRRMVEAARRNNTVFQCGTMQRSGEHFKEAAQLVREGYIGKVSRVATWIHDGESVEGIGNPPDESPPDGCDWDFHQGWTHRVPFNRNRWINSFRWFLDYSGGKITDWGAHLVDIAVWAMGEEKQPKTVTATGGKFLVTDNRTTPDTLEVVWEFPDYLLTFSNRVCNNLPHGIYKDDDHKTAGHAIVFYGTAGTLALSRGGYEIFPMTRGDKIECEPKRGERTPLNEPHWQDFADCIRSRKRPVSDVEVCHNTTRLCHMATCSYVAGCAQLGWDPARERFTGRDRAAVKKANRWAYRPYENGWKLG